MNNAIETDDDGEPRGDLPTAPAQAFPQSRVVQKPAEVFGLTRLWWLALACLVLAVGLTIWSMPAKGKQIKIKFPEGHGLQAEDAVRFRGIDVGYVEAIHLSTKMDNVEVDVRLLPSASALAVDGSRFWIVRPRLSITGVSGLETAVGHKYIEVIPGDQSGARRNVFDGLSQAPADNASSGGIEILLQADARHSVSTGSAIHYRGVDIGKVMGVGLSADARHVEVRGRIFESYRKLVTSESRFWATGGVDVDFSLREGLKLETESLDTLARGGVSMLVVGEGRAVDPGHVFPLAASVNEDWRTRADRFLLTSARLRGAVNFEATWKEKVLFRDWKKTQRFTGIAVVHEEGDRKLVIPADILSLQRDAMKGTFAISVTSTNGVSVPIETEDLVGDGVGDGETLLMLPVPANFELPNDQWLATGGAVAMQPVKSLAVRRAAEDGMYLHLPIESDDIHVIAEEAGTYWQLQNFSGDRAVWHGCPVLDASNSSLLGILLIDKTGPHVWPLVR